MRTIAVTGGCGYVGSRVALALAKEGHSVVVIDIAEPQTRGLSFGKNIEFRRADLRSPAELKHVLKDVELVVHMAADIGSLVYMHEHQADIIANNAAIDAALYPAMVQNGVKWV